MATGSSETLGAPTGGKKDISELPLPRGLSKQASAESLRIALGQLLTELISNHPILTESFLIKLIIYYNLIIQNYF